MQRPLDWEDPALAFAGGVGADRHQQAATHAPAAGSSPTRALKSAISIECPDFMRLKHVGVLDRASGPARHVRWWEEPSSQPDRVGVNLVSEYHNAGRASAVTGKNQTPPWLPSGLGRPTILVPRLGRDSHSTSCSAPAIAAIRPLHL